MTAEDLLAHFQALHDPTPRRDEFGRPLSSLPPDRGLHDARNLRRYHLIRRYQGTGLPVMARPVEEWDVEMDEDFLACRAAEAYAQEKAAQMKKRGAEHRLAVAKAQAEGA